VGDEHYTQEKNANDANLSLQRTNNLTRLHRESLKKKQRK
jgi:hypothetical protein